METWEEVMVQKHYERMIDEYKIILLGPGDTLIVPSGVLHRFRVLCSGSLIEVYWPDRHGGQVRTDDIVRETTGGRDDMDDLKQKLERAEAKT